MKSDPCFNCALPDCDHDSPNCAVRMLANRYKAKVKAGRAKEATVEEREAYNAHFDFYRYERLADAADGIRPWDRSGSKWRKPTDPKADGASA